MFMFFGVIIVIVLAVVLIGGGGIGGGTTTMAATTAPAGFFGTAGMTTAGKVVLGLFLGIVIASLLWMFDLPTSWKTTVEEQFAGGLSGARRGFAKARYQARRRMKGLGEFSLNPDSVEIDEAKITDLP